MGPNYLYYKNRVWGQCSVSNAYCPLSKNSFFQVVTASFVALLDNRMVYFAGSIPYFLIIFFMAKTKGFYFLAVAGFIFSVAALALSSYLFVNRPGTEKFNAGVNVGIENYIKVQNEEAQKQQQEANNPTLVEGDFAEDGPVLGDKDAPITMVEFSDFQCPICRAFYYRVYPEIKSKYVDTGKVKIVFRNLPLTQLHPDAFNSALAATCAREQGGDEAFFLMHDKIFEGQDPNETGAVEISVESLEQYASELKLNKTAFQSCMGSDKAKSLVQADIDLSDTAKINGTPGFIINNYRISGLRQTEYYTQFFDSLLEPVTK